MHAGQHTGEHQLPLLYAQVHEHAFRPGFIHSHTALGIALKRHARQALPIFQHPRTAHRARSRVRDDNRQRGPLRILIRHHGLDMPAIRAQRIHRGNFHPGDLTPAFPQGDPFPALACRLRENAGKCAIGMGIRADHLHHAAARRAEAPQHMARLIHAQRPARFPAAGALRQVSIRGGCAAHGKKTIPGEDRLLQIILSAAAIGILCRRKSYGQQGQHA